MSDAIVRAWRRVQHMLGRGLVTLVDDTGPVQLLQVDNGPTGPAGSLSIRDKVPRLQEWGFASNPPAGAHVGLHNIAGDRSNGWAHGSNHPAKRMKNLGSGDAALYDLRGASVWLQNGQIVIEAAGQPVVVNHATQVTINASGKVRLVTPRLEVTGDVIDNCDTQTATVAQLRAAYDAHKHTGVSAGAASTGTTDHTV